MSITVCMIYWFVMWLCYFQEQCIINVGNNWDMHDCFHQAFRCNSAMLTWFMISRAYACIDTVELPHHWRPIVTQTILSKILMILNRCLIAHLWGIFLSFKLFISFSLCILFPSVLIPGIVFCMRPANERWCYIVTSPLIGWPHTKIDPCDTVKSCYDIVNFHSK